MKILFIGDIFGKNGRDIIAKNLPWLIQEHKIDYVIANAENSAHGKGLTKKIYLELLNFQIDFFTMGNHTWAKKDVLSLLSEKNNIIRPINLNKHHRYADVGIGTKVIEIQNKKIRITNLLGSTVTFNQKQNNPFLFFDQFLKTIDSNDFHIVDFHAETTSEKNAFLRAYDGKINVIIGTHTHVPSNDFYITENNTAYITDVGMTGPFEGIIGGLVEPILKKFREQETFFRLDVQPGKNQMCSVLIEINNNDNKIINFFPIIIRDILQPSNTLFYKSK